MAEVGTWESIKGAGLLSTKALLDRFEIDGETRDKIECANRRESVTIEHPNHGVATIRDQIPMTDTALEKCLIGMEISEWYKLLNSRVFFWANWERLVRLSEAKAYRRKTQTIITIDSAKFADRYFERIELSPINSGSTIYKPQPRGRNTFKAAADFPFRDWAGKRSESTAIVEVTVENGVPDIADFVTDVVHMKEGIVIETLV